VADYASMTARIRTRIHDPDPTPAVEGRPKYPDLTYTEAIDRAIVYVGIDLCPATLVLATLTPIQEYLVELRATIEMLMIRAGEEASGAVSDVPEGTVTSVSVPDLSVSKAVSAKSGAKFWVDLCDKYITDYEHGLESCELSPDGNSAQITQGIMFRRSWRTNRRTPYEYDKALTAPSLAVAVNVDKVSISWPVVFDAYFRRYELRRSASVDMADSVAVYMNSDNHRASYEDLPGSGTWYYRLSVFNSNDLEGQSGVSSATVV